MPRTVLMILGIVAFSLALCGQTLTITAPNTGGTLYLDNPCTVRWTSSGVTGNVRLVLFRGDAKLGAIATGLEVTAGQYSWTVGRLADGTKAPEGGDYRVRIVAGAGEEGTSDFSDAPFTIAALRAQSRVSGGARPTPPPTILVVRPARGDDLAIGGPATIEWTSPAEGVSIPVTVPIVAVRQSDGRETTIAHETRNRHGSNTYPCTINPSLFSEPGDYRIRVGRSSGMHGESSVFQLVAGRRQENDLYLGPINRGVTVEQRLEIDVFRRKYRVRTTLSFRNNSPALEDRTDPEAEVTARCFWIVERQNYDGEWVECSGTVSWPHHGTLRVGPIRRLENTSQDISIEFMVHKDYVRAEAPHRVRFVLDREREFNDPDRGNNERATGNLHFERL